MWTREFGAGSSLCSEITVLTDVAKCPNCLDVWVSCGAIFIYFFAAMNVKRVDQTSEETRRSAPL